MGKQGPCYHCGVTSTPLWRNGPSEKPVLCNACGSRWRTKGTLANYTPLHARADAEENEDHRVQRLKSLSVNKNKEAKMLKRKADQENVTVKRVSPEFNHGFKKVVDEDAGNRSSSGSAISNSESCAQLGSVDGSEFTGPAQSNVWDTSVPCKRRTWVGRPKPSSVEKLRKDLYNILQEQQSSCFSGSSEEDLLFENETPMVSVEIGHGSVLMRHPHLVSREEESEASSLSVENKSSLNESYSHSGKSISNGAAKAPNFAGQAIQQEQLKRTKSQTEKLSVLGSHSSPLCSIDLKDVFNFDEFTGQFTEDEQRQLMKLLPQTESVNFPDSLRSMFESDQFKENFSLFQQLVADGVFESSSSSGAIPDDRKMLKKLALSDLTKSRLVESYHQFKEHKNGKVGTSTATTRIQNQNASNNLISIKRLSESQNRKKSETRAVMRSPKRVMKLQMNQEAAENGFSPRSVAFAFASDGSSAVFGYEGNCGSEQDLLLDVPLNGSFPQAELLPQP
ncbi:PREDICTED: GATA transcription factor 26-like isoform X2 [Tarenaya hassleriana]|uniref:GATA transcription factor 26-like isoform X1 n=1 Tax=Tarenaya hassleriana TaxID=28532 RepID=UPI00053C2766|nr:PREDICTED: GATA transcription factor 26-like isoform X1 [Tarenaya hassleriana]XP_019056221.1 PREDICTED: GATA transcription factor 26-like isoform X2 [Tarenaya hassleriana]